jgi:hypothetical protein
VFEQKVAEWRGRVEEENERVITNLLKIGDAEQKHVRGTFGTGENEWFTPPQYDGKIAEGPVARGRTPGTFPPVR